MIEQVLDHLSGYSALYIYGAIFFFSFLENVFPPSPSDVVLLVAGTLISKGTISFIPSLILTTIGSEIGFMVLYFIGSKIDMKLVKTNKIKYIPAESIEKAEHWFTKYGYLILLLNRFLPGTRSVISFFSGLSELDVKKVITLSTISAIIWNALILFLGIEFGDNIKTIDKYLSTYSTAAIILSVVVVVIALLKYFIQSKKKIDTTKK